MAEEKLPRLTEAQVRELASEKSFERGEAYYHEPQSFRSIPPLSALLAGRSPEELITLIGELIKREPELLSLVELSVETEQAARSNPPDVSVYRRQTRRALRHKSEHVVEKELRALGAPADRAAQAGDWLNAGAIYHAVMDEAVRGYDDMLREVDEDGGVAVAVDEFAQGLSQCLENSNADAQTRRTWLETLLEAELADIKMGGIDLAPSAREAVLEHANGEEWSWIEERLNAAMSKNSGWEREALARFLAAGQKRHGRAVKAPSPRRKKS